MYSVQVCDYCYQHLVMRVDSLLRAARNARSLSKDGAEIKITRNGRFIMSYRSGRRLS